MLNSTGAPPRDVISMNIVTVDSFQEEITEAIKAYDRHVVCIDKTPDQLETGLKSLIDKAVRAYINRAPGLRHGIALDKQVTVILSQTEGERRSAESTST